MASAHPCAGHHRGNISPPFHHSSEWQERRTKMTSKVVHWTPAYYILKGVVACCGAQVFIRRLLLLLRKHAFNWSCLRLELTLQDTAENTSAFHTAVWALAICWPLRQLTKKLIFSRLKFSNHSINLISHSTKILIVVVVVDTDGSLHFRNRTSFDICLFLNSPT